MSRLKLSRDSGFSRKIGTIPPNSGRAHAWTLCKGFFGGCPGACSPRKNSKFEVFKCWKCIEIVNPIITVLFLYHFKYFTIPSGGPFRLRASPPPPLPTGLTESLRLKNVCCDPDVTRHVGPIDDEPLLLH